MLKADILKSLHGKLKYSRTLECLIIKRAEWLNSSSQIFYQIKAFAESKKIIVRSSAKNEDQRNSSAAGCYTSIANISADDFQQISDSINKVFESYSTASLDECCLIQHYIAEPLLSGVVFTVDQENAAPYYIINYDTAKDGTDGVTSGSKSSLKTLISYKWDAQVVSDPLMAKVIKSVREIEAFFAEDHLDIEFLIDANQTVTILQVRTLIINQAADEKIQLSFSNHLRKLELLFLNKQAADSRILGSRTLYSVMSDWNPAEMIGIRPSSLALSLYQTLITDQVWAEMRYNYGYRDLRDIALLISFSAHPYIDLRVSFNSFIPASIRDSCAEKLTNYYLDQLAAQPSLHDKIESKIIFASYDLALKKRITKLLAFGFSEDELEEIVTALIALTKKVVEPRDALYLKDLAWIEELKQKQSELNQLKLNCLDKIKYLITTCKSYGTLPFCGLARSCFIAMQFLNSFKELNIFTERDAQAFLNSLTTITRKITKDFARFRNGAINKASFLDQYGHLRPGTYDILSTNYSQTFERYFDLAYEVSANSEDTVFALSNDQCKKIDQHLEQANIELDAAGLLEFMRCAIEGREYAKFIFSKNISLALNEIKNLGLEYNLTTQELSHINLKEILKLDGYSKSSEIEECLLSSIKENSQLYKLSSQIRLPQLISSSNDIYQHYLMESEPNFITRIMVSGEVILENQIHNCNLNGKIVFIRSADPGYDWIFTHKISGLVTEFGGANSHMAIRCSELNIPAVIGCGEAFFARLSKAKFLELDCSNKRVLISNLFQ